MAAVGRGRWRAGSGRRPADDDRDGVGRTGRGGRRTRASGSAGSSRRCTGRGRTGFGAAWPGYIGSLSLDNTPDDPRPWGALVRGNAGCWPYLRARPIAGPSPMADVDVVEQIIDDHAVRPPANHPAGCTATCGRGTCSGAPTGGPGWWIPAAQGGHRETDLASSRCSVGSPIWTRSSRAYQEVWPLADGWRPRVPLHQLHLLLVHTALFGVAYRVRACRRGRLLRLSRRRVAVRAGGGTCSQGRITSDGLRADALGGWVRRHRDQSR